MQGFYQWIKQIVQAKINIFFKGFFGGGFVLGIFLFGSNFHSTFALLLEYSLKLLATVVGALFSGCFTVAGNDLYKWLKLKWRKLTVKRKTIINRKKKAA